jgi:hypothetical protein
LRNLRSQFAAQAADVIVDTAIEHGVLALQHLLEQPLTGDDAACGCEQDPQDLELE